MEKGKEVNLTDEVLVSLPVKDLNSTLRSFSAQIVQSVIYGADTVVTEVLTPAVLSLDGQLGLFPFAEYEQTKT